MKNIALVEFSELRFFFFRAKLREQSSHFPIHVVHLRTKMRSLLYQISAVIPKMAIVNNWLRLCQLVFRLWVHSISANYCYELFSNISISRRHHGSSVKRLPISIPNRPCGHKWQLDFCKTISSHSSFNFQNQHPTHRDKLWLEANLI